MSESLRIRTTPNGGDKYVKLKLEQDFDFVEILSLSLTQEEVYQKFCSDYGVVVGRVIANSGFGVPNAKVSIFIPIDELDAQNVETSGLYPYESVNDKNIDGIRYNLLPKEPQSDNECFTPVGTFPSKREVLDNPELLNIYCKYYKFTATTNYAGDFMIFGVPVGTYTLHVDVDLSDIGIASQRPYDFIKQGSPTKLFTSSTKFKGGTNLDKLVQIKSYNIGVNVQPFWGDLENCEIGITRADVDLNFTIEPSAIFIGSIYGDQEKNSINKNCRPRKKLGEICEQVTGKGTIEIIRKNIDNEIEEFLFDSQEVIDEDGTWAFQIPMNLDYMITDETGQLILTDDQNRGIPTRASVRFRIGLDETGSDGRLRTRAKYLVPNNPQTISEIDYNFDENTKDTSFKNLYWNKIYTVSNFISRYQKKLSGVANRNATGMKNIDNCPGDKNPFPYNRVKTSANPIFFLLCLIIKIVGFIVFITNFFLIGSINILIGIAINIVNFINSLGANITVPSYVPCITVACPTDDDPKIFAPGCSENSPGYGAANPQINYACGGNNGPCVSAPPNLVGLDDCLAFQIAQELDIFEFDFYNDWVTGTLFSYLLKYKKRRGGNEKFCEFDCADFTNDANYSGVDLNNNGIPDNDCTNNKLLDTCYSCNTSQCQKESYESSVIREGLVKKYKDELYYAATTHNNSFKLFATDIVCLGSVFSCDWQGYPKLQPLLVTTSYKMPPEIDELSDDNTTILTSGQVKIGNNSQGLFFNINCTGLSVDTRQCLNLRHICEIGVDLDEAIFDPVTGNIVEQANGNLGSNDIDGTFNKDFRDAYLYINNTAQFPPIYNQPTNINSDFNVNNVAVYNFATVPSNGVEYVTFRGYPNSSTFSQPKHSFFMYFGIIPNRTAIDKMNEIYFASCPLFIDTDMVIDAASTPTTQPNTFDGTITFSFIGSQGPYIYTISGPNNYSVSGNTTNLTIPTITVTGLEQGTYTINGFDSNGNPVNQTVVVGGPPQFYCTASVTQNNTSLSVPDGQITINVGGGLPPYSYTVFNENGAALPTNNNVTITNSPYIINNLASASVNGYSVEVVDTNGNICLTTGLTLSGPNSINIGYTTNQVSCFNGNDGAIQLNITGAQPPYFLTTSGTSQTNSNFLSTSLNMTNLSVGSYLTTVQDANGQIVTQQINITSSAPALTINSVSVSQLSKQCNPNVYNIPFYVNNGLAAGGTAYIEYRLDNSTTWNYLNNNPTFINTSTPLSFTVPNNAFSNSITFRFSNTANHVCHSNIITYNKVQMPLPASQLSGSINVVGGQTTITALGGISPYICSINGNAPIPMNGLPASITVNYQVNNVLITDSVGCQVSV